MIVSTDITIDDYHASDYVSHSKLRTFADVGAFGYRARHLIGANRQEVTEAMRFGQAFETFIQEPAEFAKRYKEAPALEGKADDALLAEALAANVLQDDGKPYTKRHDAKTVHLAMLRAEGGEVMSAADMKRIERMAESFTRNTKAVELVRGMQTQVTLREDFGGLDMLPGIQSRPDWYHTECTVDLKAIADFNGFDRTIVASGHHAQAALINLIEGARNPRYLIACENVWPFRCQVVNIPAELIFAGEQWCHDQLAALRECYQRDEWPLCEPFRVAEVPRRLRSE